MDNNTFNQPSAASEEITSGGASTGSRKVSGGVAMAAIGGAVVVGVGIFALTGGLSSSSGSKSSGAARTGAAPKPASLATSACSGPKGTAYVVNPGWDGFTAINTADCSVINTYNVADRLVKGSPDNQDYDSAALGVALSGNDLYFADTGNSTVGIVDITKLTASNYNPADKVINVGLFPQAVTVQPGGKYVWVADTGPETTGSNYGKISVLSTATDKVVATFNTAPGPREIQFGGGKAYVVTDQGLEVFGAASHKVVSKPDHRKLDYLLVTDQGKTEYSAPVRPVLEREHSGRTGSMTVTRTGGNVGWNMLLSSNGKTLYVTAPNSSHVLVVKAASLKIEKTITVPSAPTSLALTKDGSELWVGENSAGNVAVVSTATDQVTATVNMGFGYGATGMVITPKTISGS